MKRSLSVAHGKTAFIGAGALLGAAFALSVAYRPALFAGIVQVPEIQSELDDIRPSGTSSPSADVLNQVAKDLAKTRKSSLAAAGRFPGAPTGRAITPEAFQRRPGSVLVRVYFHVITSSAGVGNVTDQQIIQQIRALNIAFSGTKTLPDGTQPRGAGQNTPFRFVLAGVDRTVDDESFIRGIVQESPEENALKQRLYRGTSRDLNIYTGIPIATRIARYTDDPVSNPTAQVLGYATYPWEFPRVTYTDGITIDFRTLPLNTLVGNNYNQGMTAVRCVGNWLGLLGTFENGCTPTNDQIADTPAERYPYLGGDWRENPNTLAIEEPDTCTGRSFPGKDPVDNFMDFTRDAFMYRFTREQSLRMDSCAITYRYL